MPDSAWLFLFCAIGAAGGWALRGVQDAGERWKDAHVWLKLSNRTAALEREMADLRARCADDGK